MDVIYCIKERRSIRKYTAQKINEEIKNMIINAAIYAPSGKNGQPWRFKCIENEQQIKAIAQESIYRMWIEKSVLLIAVFLDKDSSYDYIKDAQSSGAAIQNMLLAAKAVEIGSCWIGEILSKQEKVKEILNISDDKYELMGIVAFGYSNESPAPPAKKEIADFLI